MPQTPIGLTSFPTSNTGFPGVIAPGVNNVVNQLTQWMQGFGGGLGNLLQPVLTALQPSEALAGQNLEDSYRRAGNLPSGAFAEASQNFQNQLTAQHGALGAQMYLQALNALPGFKTSQSNTVLPSNLAQILSALSPFLTAGVMTAGQGQEGGLIGWLLRALGITGGNASGTPAPQTGSAIPGNFNLGGQLGGLGNLGNFQPGADLTDFLNSLSPGDFLNTIGNISPDQLFGNLQVPDFGGSLNDLLNPGFGLGGFDFSNLDLGNFDIGSLGNLSDFNLGNLGGLDLFSSIFG